MTQREVLVIGSASQSIVQALVHCLDESGRTDVIVIDGSERRQPDAGLGEILSKLDDMLEWPAFLVIPAEDTRLFYLCCLLALYRKLLAVHDRADPVGVDTPLTLMAYILARDGPGDGEHRSQMNA